MDLFAWRKASQTTSCPFLFSLLFLNHRDILHILLSAKKKQYFIPQKFQTAVLPPGILNLISLNKHL